MEFSLGGIFVGGIFVGGIFVGGIFGSRNLQWLLRYAILFVCALGEIGK